MKKNELPPEQLAEDIYQRLPWPYPKLAAALIILLLFSFGVYFSLPALLSQAVKNAIDNNRACTMIYRQLNFEYFIPKIRIKNLSLGSNCFGNQLALGQVSFDDVKIYLGIPSIWPFGPKVVAQITKNKRVLKVAAVVGIGGVTLKIDHGGKKRLDLALINDILGVDYFAGHLEAQVVAKLRWAKKSLLPQEVNARLESKDLLVRSFSLSGLQLPLLPLNILQLKFTLDKKQNFKLTEDLVLGYENSPFRIHGKGGAKFNWQDLASSNLDLHLQAIFTDAFLEEFAVLPMMLSKFEKDAEGWYQINLEGPLGNYLP
ncbi:MAG: hypothetical protein J6Y94_04410 [Bacteriovoracaceae bacterium]|nr:hypothetical protein [Bacteriovoracaceae bacterium]